ncbi:MAG: hypothetical protein ACRDO0_13300 [Nocardioidaceae bacterium]
MDILDWDTFGYAGAPEQQLVLWSVTGSSSSPQAGIAHVSATVKLCDMKTEPEA